MEVLNHKGYRMSIVYVHMPDEIECAPKEIRDHYCRMIQDGQSESWALMCALQAPPGTKGSDRAFMQGRLNNQQLDEMPVNQARYISREARQAGISIEGKYYCGGIADKRGWRDPRAWVGGNDEILTVAKERRLMVSGSVNYDPGVAPPKRVKMSESIISEEAQRYKKLHPKLSKGELRNMVVEKHSYKAKNRGV